MTTARAHPNIALIKYWGKQPGPDNYSATPSLSITLDDIVTTTRVEDAPREDRVELNGETVRDAKIDGCLTELRSRYAIPPLVIRTENNFPTAAGLASSASGFAALITAIDAHCGLEMSDAVRSDLARRASGSAARSIFGGFVGLCPPDWIARPLLPPEAWPLQVVIAIVDTTRKAVSSTEGMERSRTTSDFYPAWVQSTADDYRSAEQAVVAQDFDRLATLSETSCLKMHGVMQSSRPPMIYWRPATLACMHCVQTLRGDGIPVFFTIDAGPQVKAVCAPGHAGQVARAFEAIPGVLDTRTVGLGRGAGVV